MSPEDPTDVMPGGPDRPTEVNPAGDEPTRVNPAGGEPAGVRPGAGADEAGNAGLPPARPANDRGRAGIGVLIGAILASLILVGSYVAAGGPVGPDRPADPCDPRPWSDPGNLEETAQQFALSAADGAACELGVSREELTRSIADDQTRQQFMDEHGFSETELEDALRAGLNRAVDDAENAGALSSLAASGVRLAIRVMPMSVMIGLLENAEGIFNGDFGSLGGVGDAIDAITGGIGSGTADDPLGSLGDEIEGALPEGTTDAIEELIPEETRRKLEDEARQRLNEGLDGLLAP